MASFDSSPDAEQTFISAAGCIAVIVSGNQLPHKPIGERLENFKITGREFFRLRVLHIYTSLSARA
jgi:hypothetical protein